jgi:hypothetical protein
MSNKTTPLSYSIFKLPVFGAAVFLLAALSLTGCWASPLPETGPTVTLLPTPQPLETSEAMAAYPPPVIAYPGPSDPAPTTTGAAYPEPVTTAPQIPASATPGEIVAGDAVYAPLISAGAPPPEIATPEPTATATATPEPTQPLSALGPLPTPISLVDFAAVRDDLAAQGQQLAYNKIGFHVTFLEDREELDPYMERLDAEGVPFFLKSVDNAEPLFKAQELMKASGVPHTLVYRSTQYDVPDYDMAPILAAEAYWELEKAIWPPELDPDLVWFETMNELDKGRSEWLAQFALRTAQLALRDGYRWAAFGWASGEPEPADWESPAMLELLRLIGENPDRLAIALHEYSYTTDDIGDDYPHKIGRFLDLFRVADEHGIPRPTVLITEFGWAYNNIPPEPLAMEDVAWAARLYGAYPQVLGAAIWNIGRLDDQLLPLNDQMQELIDNMLAISLDSYFSAPLPPLQAPLDANQYPPPGN